MKTQRTDAPCRLAFVVRHPKFAVWMLSVKRVFWAQCPPMNQKLAFTVYTIGYEGTTIEAFVATLLEQRIAHLIDIREVAMSRKKGFSKTALSQHVGHAGIRYSHFRALGCPRPIRDEYRNDGNWSRYVRAFTEYLQSQAAALAELTGAIQAERCSLMCFEADYAHCHRSLVSQKLGGDIVHLTSRGPVREATAAVA